MTLGKWLMIFGLGSAWLCFTLPAQSQQKVKVYRTVSATMVEKTLHGLKIAFLKKTGKKEEGTYYDFSLKNSKVRLHNYDGKELWISAWFADPLTLAQVNDWNMDAKFSRAVLIPLPSQDIISLEQQLNCRRGVTEGMLRQLILRFGEELAHFRAQFRGS